MRLITIFLPTYNGSRFVAQAVRSLLAQTHREFELVVFDDDSTDDTVAVVRAAADDPRLRLERGARRGAAGNWNRALERVETPFFLIAHQDDVYEPEFVGEMLDQLQRYPRAFLAHCRAATIDEHGHPVRAPADHYKASFWPAGECYERSGRAELRALLNGSYIVTPSAVYRTSAVRAIGFFDTYYRQSIDWDYWLRGVLAGFSVVGVNRPLMSYRRHPGMTTCVTEQDFTRYRDEVRVLSWIAEAAFRAGLADTDRPDYSAVVNTVMSKFAMQLTTAERARARALLNFAVESIPGFAGSLEHRVAQAACSLGPLGGRVLQLAESACFSLLRLGRWPALRPERQRIVAGA